MSILNMTLLFLLASCSLLSGPKSLKNEDKEKLLEKIQLTGEGRGRLALGENQYVFGFESVLQENFDWILAVEIPLHGEEVMVLQDLKSKDVKKSSMKSFEMRLARELRLRKLTDLLTPEEFLKEFRSLVRFNLARKWGQTPVCHKRQEMLDCELDNEKFLITSSDKEIFVTRELKRGGKIVLEAKVMHDKMFERTDIRLYSSEENAIKKSSALSLELFWKN